MTILRLSAQASAALMRDRSAPTSVCDVSRVGAVGKTAKPLGKDHEQANALGDRSLRPHERCDGGGLAGSPCHRPRRAAARLLRAIVRWQIRRLERRLATLEVDERSPALGPTAGIDRHAF